MGVQLKISDNRDDELNYLNICVGTVIRKLRRERNLSGEILGTLTGYSQQQISRYERGGCNFTIPVLMRFADAFNISVWDLIDKIRVFYITGNDNYYPDDKWGGSLYL